LEKEKADLAQVAGRAQYDYLNLKTDFDRYQRMQSEQSKTQDVDSLIKIVKKFLPFLENLRKSLLTISEDKKEDVLIK
jgi:molecular chaperone GrpE (heat shock protein)